MNICYSHTTGGIYFSLHENYFLLQWKLGLLFCNKFCRFEFLSKINIFILLL